jgi:hypothetical protein
MDTDIEYKTSRKIPAIITSQKFRKIIVNKTANAAATYHGAKNTQKNNIISARILFIIP